VGLLVAADGLSHARDVKGPALSRADEHVLYHRPQGRRYQLTRSHGNPGTIPSWWSAFTRLLVNLVRHIVRRRDSVPGVAKKLFAGCFPPKSTEASGQQSPCES